MKTTIRTPLGAAVLAALLLPAAWALPQGYGQQPQTPPKPPQPGQSTPAADTPAPPPVNAEEEAAHKAFVDIKNTDIPQKVQAGEDFLKKYPDSRYRPDVYARLTNAYWMAGQPDKMFVAGDKALELNPGNVDVLAPMSLVLSRSVNPGSLDAAQKLEKSEQYAKRCISVLDTVAKPAGMSDEDFTKAKSEKASMCHSGLGVTYYHRQKYADSASELEQSVKLSSMPDPVDYFVLGLADEQTQHFTDAVTAFTKCGEAPGPMQARCKASLDDAKKKAATMPSAPK